MCVGVTVIWDSLENLGAKTRYFVHRRIRYEFSANRAKGMDSEGYCISQQSFPGRIFCQFSQQ
jgi:hypothetical protein